MRVDATHIGMCQSCGGDVGMLGGHAPAAKDGHGLFPQQFGVYS
jgi:hypothetical protein